MTLFLLDTSAISDFIVNQPNVVRRIAVSLALGDTLDCATQFILKSCVGFCGEMRPQKSASITKELFL